VTTSENPAGFSFALWRCISAMWQNKRIYIYKLTSTFLSSFADGSLVHLRWKSTKADCILRIPKSVLTTFEISNCRLYRIKQQTVSASGTATSRKLKRQHEMPVLVSQWHGETNVKATLKVIRKLHSIMICEVTGLMEIIKHTKNFKMLAKHERKNYFHADTDKTGDEFSFSMLVTWSPPSVALPSKSSLTSTPLSCKISRRILIS